MYQFFIFYYLFNILFSTSPSVWRKLDCVTLSIVLKIRKVDTDLTSCTYLQIAVR